MSKQRHIPTKAEVDRHHQIIGAPVKIITLEELMQIYGNHLTTEQLQQLRNESNKEEQQGRSTEQLQIPIRDQESGYTNSNTEGYTDTQTESGGTTE